MHCQLLQNSQKGEYGVSRRLLANDGVVKHVLAVSVYSFFFFFDQSSVSPHCKCHPILSTAAAVICLLTDVTRQPWPSPGLRLAPDWTRSVTYAGFLFEYAVCASLDKKEN